MNRFAQLLDRLAYEPGRKQQDQAARCVLPRDEDPDRGYALAALDRRAVVQAPKRV